MHNLAPTVILADQRRRQCPCGAVADRPFEFCRKCRDRNAWRRRPPLSGARPPAGPSPAVSGPRPARFSSSTSTATDWRA